MNGQTDAIFGYRCHASVDAHYIIQCLMGDVLEIRDLPRVAPMETPGLFGGGQESGVQPQGGVQNLAFTQDADGKRSMDYTYNGKAFSMRYTPANTAD